MKSNHNLVKRSILAVLTLSVSLGTIGCSGRNTGSNSSGTTFKKDEIKQGDVVTFGSFEQDNDTSNGAEPIEWIVLNVDADNDRAFLLSKKALDTRKYHDDHGTPVRMTWAECDLRLWLNGDFYSGAFDSKEKNEIVPQFVDNNDNAVYFTEGGDRTREYVMLLSMEEVTDPNNGFSSDRGNDDVARRCAASTYAASRGMSTSPVYPTADGEEGGVWWLRSTGGTPIYAATIIHDGRVDANGWDYGSDGAGVRPAIYVKIQ